MCSHTEPVFVLHDQIRLYFFLQSEIKQKLKHNWIPIGGNGCLIVLSNMREIDDVLSNPTEVAQYE